MKYKNVLLSAVACIAFYGVLAFLARFSNAKASRDIVAHIESSWLHVKKGTLYPHDNRTTKAGVVWTYVSTDDNRLHRALIKDGWVIEKDGVVIDYHPDVSDK